MVEIHARMRYGKDNGVEERGMEGHTERKRKKERRDREKEKEKEKEKEGEKWNSAKYFPIELSIQDCSIAGVTVFHSIHNF